jgi:hypothetical protein
LRRRSLQKTGRVQAVHHWHQEVQQNQVRVQSPSFLNCFPSVFCRSANQKVRLPLQKLAQRFPNKSIVIGDQNGVSLAWRFETTLLANIQPTTIWTGTGQAHRLSEQLHLMQPSEDAVPTTLCLGSQFSFNHLQHFPTRLLQATVAVFVANYCTASTGLLDKWFRRSIASPDLLQMEVCVDACSIRHAPSHPSLPSLSAPRQRPTV